MGAPRILFPFAIAVPLLFLAPNLFAQTSPASRLLDSKSAPVTSTLKIVLRLEDESPFLGSATVRVTPEEGNELLGMPADAAGEFLFSGVAPGKYVAFVGAPGFAALSLNFKIDDGPRQKSLFIPMKPTLSSRPAAVSILEPITVDLGTAGSSGSPAEKSAAHGGIAQNNSGDGDGDNNGGPSDGDGDI